MSQEMIQDKIKLVLASRIGEFLTKEELYELVRPLLPPHDRGYSKRTFERVIRKLPGLQTRFEHGLRCYALPLEEHNDTPFITNTTFPKYKTIPVWECSDGREYSGELEALRHEVDIMRDRLRNGRK